jgi:hypothetical protein
MSTRMTYAQIDINSVPDGELWPSVVPLLTGPEAVRAARRLWRFAMGATYSGNVVVTSGNRHTWTHWQGNALELRVNPDQGWRHFIHDLSHLFVTRANPGIKPHTTFHARFEKRLVREVVKRGWLDGRLRDVPAVKAAATLNERHADKLKAIDSRLVQWERKHKRAERALQKLRRQRSYYNKALSASHF